MSAFGQYEDDGTASTMKMRDYKDATDLVATFTNKGHFGGMSETEVSDPLRSKGGDTGNGGESLVVAESQYGDIAGTLTSRHDSSPCADRGQNVVCVHGTQDPCVSEHTAFVLGRNQGGENVVAYGIPGNWIGREPKNGGNAIAQNTRDESLVVSGCLTPGLPQRVRVHGTEGVSPTIMAPCAVMFEPRCVRTTGGQPQDELSHCLRADTNSGDGAPCVAFAQNTRDEVREMAVVGALAAQPGMKQTSYIRHAMAVRRLTPTECARLQGFPDSHAKIPWRGKSAEECPDGPQYKCYGNSMAVPVISWLGKQIAKHLHL